MSWNSPNIDRPDESRHEAEETLRLVAELPEPAQLTERVHRRIADAQVMPERRGFWSLWLPAQRFQFAAAAALAIAVAGSMWSVYHGHPQAGTAKQSPAPVQSTPPSAGHFDSAGAVRVPPTLKPIQVPQGSKKKPAASHAKTKPSPKVLAAQP
ncbi:MAG TPA: hypothetical protein VHZ52_17255 [Acidobacteriaceae bacterium]|jgi:hypothetical protein|nr:hypothetical protein [Acidobacteriaceae bacterium]